LWNIEGNGFKVFFFPERFFFDGMKIWKFIFVALPVYLYKTEDTMLPRVLSRYKTAPCYRLRSFPLLHNSENSGINPLEI
jgi:hypothetical protein